MTTPNKPIEVRVDKVRARRAPDGSVEILVDGQPAMRLTPTPDPPSTQIALRRLACDFDYSA